MYRVKLQVTPSFVGMFMESKITIKSLEYVNKKGRNGHE